jgi:hypothetical protein
MGKGIEAFAGGIDFSGFKSKNYFTSGSDLVLNFKK